MNNSYSYADSVRSLQDHNAFDPYEDFCQFLEEAKQHAQETTDLQRLEPENKKLAADKVLVKNKNSKKSWKVFHIISWLKGGKPRAQPSSTLAALKSKKASNSGPLCSRERRDYVTPKRQLSGQLNGLLTPLKKMETNMRYISLTKVDSESLRPYGPLYSVR